MKKVIYSLCACFLLLAIFEVLLRVYLFENVSYSNSESIDNQLKERDKTSGWDILFVGDSETRWGINPSEIDSAFMKHGMNISSFNHAFDGFGASWWVSIIPNLLQTPSLADVKVVAVGVQLTSGHRIITSEKDCGALQKPVMTSSFGVDLRLDSLCSPNLGWETKLVSNLFSKLWSVNYSPAVRTLLLPDFMSTGSKDFLRFNSSKSGEPVNGFVPHHSISENEDKYESEFKRWKEQYDPEVDFARLPPQEWRELTSKSGFFDNLNKAVSQTGRKLVLFSLPTNPVVIDTFNRRDDYNRNSRLLRQWAEDRNVTFIDFGIQDVPNPKEYFSDMRHLSGKGATEFSKNLGDSLASELNCFKENK